MHNTFFWIYICISNYYTVIMLNSRQKNIATFIHLSSFLRFIIPLGNFLGPLLFWLINRDKSSFIDANGKQALNFQISFLIYTVIIGALTIPFLIFGVLGHIRFYDMQAWQNISIDGEASLSFVVLLAVLGTLILAGFIFELICVVIAGIKASDGIVYNYPLTINFFK